MIVGEKITLPQVHTWQVYLAKQPNFLGLQVGDQINLDDYELVAKINGQYAPFHITQNIDDAWVDNDTTLEVYGDNQGGCRSVSVSDIICNTITGQCYIVNNIGYRLLLDEETKSADTSDRERFIDNIYCEWCGELYDGTEILDNYTAKIVHRRCAAANNYDAETFEAPSYGNYYGACLLPNGSCSETTLEMCREIGGRFQGPGTSCNPDDNYLKPRVMRSESSNQLGKGLTIGIVAGIISGLVTTVFGTLISEILLDRLREEPILEITDEELDSNNTP